MNEDELAAVPDAVRRARLREAEDRYRRAGAHFVAERFSDCLTVIEEIEHRLARGERP